MVKYLNEHGLQTHEETDASEHAVVLGYVIDGVKLEVLPRPERITRLELGLVPLIRGLPVTGRNLEVILGHLVSVMMVSRWA